MDGEDDLDLTPFGRVLPLLRDMSLLDLLTGDDPRIDTAAEWIAQDLRGQNPEDGHC